MVQSEEAVKDLYKVIKEEMMMRKISVSILTQQIIIVILERVNAL